MRSLTKTQQSLFPRTVYMWFVGLFYAVLVFTEPLQYSVRIVCDLTWHSTYLQVQFGSGALFVIVNILLDSNISKLMYILPSKSVFSFRQLPVQSKKFEQVLLIKGNPTVYLQVCYTILLIHTETTTFSCVLWEHSVFRKIVNSKDSDRGKWQKTRDLH